MPANLSQRHIAWLLLVCSSLAFACDEKGAFGFEFGKPVPGKATRELSGGTGAACYEGVVPAPIPGFESYGYCALRSRKFVYSLEAHRPIPGRETLEGAQAQGPEAKEKLKQEVLALVKEWEEKFGFKYESNWDSGLSWTAETPTLSSRIAVSGPELVIECTNKALENKAFAQGLKSL